ncbi:MAG: hypothetical protein MZU91_02535 [Desulfosudis oleivorans]|nr:hypothetical protein [Desulfosudis oleivorans]
MTLAILLIVLIPLTLAVLAIVNNAEDISARAQIAGFCPSRHTPPAVARTTFRSQARSSAAQWSAFAALSPEERSSLRGSVCTNSACCGSSQRPGASA